MAQQQSVERPESPPNVIAPNEKDHSSSGYATLGIVGLVVVALIAALVVVALQRLQHVKDLNAAAAGLSSALTRVSVATAHRAPPTSELTLPGNAQPFRGTALYGRANGYLTRWLVDIGDHVKEGAIAGRDQHSGRGRPAGPGAGEPRPGQRQSAGGRGQPRAGQDHAQTEPRVRTAEAQARSRS